MGDSSHIWQLIMVGQVVMAFYEVNWLPRAPMQNALAALAPVYWLGSVAPNSHTFFGARLSGKAYLRGLRRRQSEDDS